MRVSFLILMMAATLVSAEGYMAAEPYYIQNQSANAGGQVYLTLTASWSLEV